MSNETEMPLAHVMQHQSAAVATAGVEALEKPVDEAAVPEVTVKPKPAPLSQLTGALMVNLNLTDRSTFSDLKEFKLVTGSNGKYNLYHPFKAQSEDMKWGTSVVRSAIANALDILEDINRSHVSVLGDPGQVEAHFNSFLSNVVDSVNSVLPWKPNDEVGVVNLVAQDDETDFLAIPLKLRDFVRVAGWVTAPDLEDGNVTRPYNLVTNFTINSSALYDSKDPQKSVRFVQAELSRMKKAKEASTSIIIGITIPVHELMNPLVRDMVNVLLSDDEKNGYTAIGRTELYSHSMDWVPQRDEEVGEKLLTTGGEIFLAKVI